MNKLLPLFTFSILLLIPIGAQQAFAAPTFLGPTPYLSTADSPFPIGSAACSLEDFEDGTLDFGITATAGMVIGPGGGTDSVDADDGAIDGSGTAGRSFNDGSGATTTFTLMFASMVTDAGYVWTDGISPPALTTFEAFGPGMVSLGTIGPVAIGDGLTSGQTAEDRFFGVHDPNGIMAIKLTQSANGFEVDHVQFCISELVGGEFSPIDSTALMLAGAQSFSWMIPVVLSVLGIGLFAVSRKSE